MSVITQYPFTTPANYTYDPLLIEVNGGVAQLILADNPGQDFVEDFAVDTGFTYDSTFTEFVAGVMRQIDTRPANATFYASYDSSIGGNWGGGTLTGSAVGGASVSGNRLDLAHNDLRYVSYEDTGLVDSGQVGTIRFKYTPNYSNSPAANVSLFVIQQSSVSNFNQIALSHRSSGQILIYSRNNVGGVELNNNWHFWQPTAATTYEIEVNFDFTTGATRIFIDGTQQGGTLANTYTRDATSQFLGVGADHAGSVSNGYFEDVLIFSTVQHTSNYVPDWSNIYETPYIGDVITLPEMEYTGVGTLISFDNFLTTEANSPRYTLQIGRSGNYLYWDGGAWATSNNTFAQANDKATFLANIATLPVNGEIYGQFRIYTDDGNSQMSIDELTATLTAQIYSTTNPTIYPASGMSMDALISFTETITAAGGDAVHYTLQYGGVQYWWDGGAWAVSTGTYGVDTNTGAEINTNAATFLLSGSPQTVIPIIYLHSNDGSSTPQIDIISFNYDYYAPSPAAPNQCAVYGYLKGPDGSALEGARVTAQLNQMGIYNLTTLIPPEVFEVTTDSFGFFQLPLVETASMTPASIGYIFTFEYLGDVVETSLKSVPDQVSAEYGSL